VSTNSKRPTTMLCLLSQGTGYYRYGVQMDEVRRNAVAAPTPSWQQLSLSLILRK
jgi:hypothetical protein